MRGIFAPLFRLNIDTAFLLAAVSLAVLPLRAEDISPTPGAEQPKIAALIKQLGDQNSKRREAASEQLANLGMATRAALTAELNNPDLEVRRRVKRLLAAVLAEDFRRRLEAFADDTDGV